MEALTEMVAKAICKSKSCEGVACCQWPANRGRSLAECPVWRGGYTDAALDVIEAMTKHALMAERARESNRQIDELEAQFGKI